MYNIAITAGGTSENIDGVRKLTNVSTGSLGWNCLESTLSYFLSKNENNFRVHYILTPTAYRGQLSDEQKSYVNFIEVTDAQSVYDVVNNLTKDINITHFIHSMAISDFTFSYAVTVDNLAEEIATYINNGGEVSAEKIQELLTLPKSRNEEGAKISSSQPLIIGLKTTKKVISLIKDNNKDTVLIGFKLLRNVGEDTLMEVSEQLKRKNECDFVFANELSKISGDDHTGILIKNGNIVSRPTGKRQIADAIIENMINN